MQSLDQRTVPDVAADANNGWAPVRSERRHLPNEAIEHQLPLGEHCGVAVPAEMQVSEVEEGYVCHGSSLRRIGCCWVSYSSST